jgi:hypothetical protein
MIQAALGGASAEHTAHRELMCQPLIAPAQQAGAGDGAFRNSLTSETPTRNND